MSPIFALVLALVALSGGTAAAQEDDPSAWSLDALIQRLPQVRHEWTGAGSEQRLDPASAELARRLDKGVVLSDEQWRRALLDTDALRVRTRWPASEPFRVSLLRPAWLGRRVLVLDPLPSDLPLRSAHVGIFYVGLCGNMEMADARRALDQPLGYLPVGRRRLDFALELLERQGGDARGSSNDFWLEEHVERDAQDREPASFRRAARAPRFVATAELALELEIVPTLDDALPPVSSPELDTAVRRALVVRPTTWPPGPEELALTLCSGDELDPLLARVALALEVEFLRDGEVRDAGVFQRDYGCDPFVGCGAGHALSLKVLPPEAESNARELERWSLRVRSTDENVLYDWQAERRWHGAFELPLAEAFERARELRKR